MTNLKTLLLSYFDIQRAIFEQFGYQQDWAVIPLEDNTKLYWMSVGGEGADGEFVYSENPFTESSIKAGKTVYSGRIYTQRHLPKWVYRTDEFTMACIDTQTDLNRLLMVFDNSKECADEQLKKLYKECWG